MKIPSSPIGAPCWFEFSSTDAPRSLQFLCDVFGWTPQHQDMGEYGTYTFLEHADGGMVGAHWTMPEEPLKQGVPSNWCPYFKVASVDESRALALKMGATEIVPPMPVQEYGRMSVLSDPGGAVFSIWQDLQPSEEPLVMFELNAMGWVELATRHSKEVKAFYSKLLGWTYTPSSLPGGYEYTEWSAGDTRYGGILPMTKEWDGIPSCWGVYVVVADTDACVKKVLELGGKTVVQPFDIPKLGRIAVISEPTGGTFSVITLLN